MQILELQTGGHKVESIRWNNQILYKQRLPFDTYIYQGRKDYSPPFEFPVTSYLDFSGLDPNNVESDSNVGFSYSNRTNYNDSDMYYGRGELQLKKSGSLAGEVGSQIPYFKITLPPRESVKVTMEFEKYQRYSTNVSHWRYYLFYSEKLVAASNLTKLIKYDGYISENTDCYVRDFENAGSLYQEYLNNNIIIPFSSGIVTISNPTDENKSFYFYFCINGGGNESSGYKNFGLGKITLERMVA